MARQVLDNGVILPSEYSDDWYDDMTSNLTKLDEVIGSDAEKLDESDVGAAAISNDYDDLDDKPTYNILRRASVTLTAGGTGNYSDLDSDSKIKAGDYVLDAANKLYSITAIDAANSTYTVSAAALFTVTDKAELGAAALSNDYDDLDNLPTFNVLRRAAVTLTAGGTGNYSDLDSDSKIKAGDYVLDAANKLYSITAVDAANSTYTVSAAALFTVTDKAELGAAALSNSYDDLNNLPGYGILRFCSTAITDNSNIAFANISSVSKIAAGDFLLDTAGKLYQIASVDTVNETAAVTTPVTQLALDANVMHLSGNETKSGELTVSKLISNTVQSATGDIKVQSLGSNRSVSMFNGASAGDGGGFWAYGKDSANGSDCRIQIYNTSKSRYERVDLVNSQFLPTPSGEIDCGGTSNKWKSINGINPGALSLPDFSNAIDISGYITVTGGSTTENLYTPLADGYISVNLGRSSGAIGLIISNGKIEACVRENTFRDNHRECGGFIPVQKNDNVVITSCLADSIIWAYFIPCKGNI